MNDTKWTIAPRATITEAVTEFFAVATMGLKAHLAKTNGDAPFTPTIVKAKPRVNDAVIFDRAPGVAAAAISKLQDGATKFSGAIQELHDRVADGATKVTNPDGSYRYVMKQDVADWDCCDITDARYKASFYLHEMCGQLAALQSAMQDLFSNIELLQVCPPHRCEDPHFLQDSTRDTSKQPVAQRRTKTRGTAREKRSQAAG